MAELEELVLPTSCAVTADVLLRWTRALPFGRGRATCEAGTNGAGTEGAGTGGTEREGRRAGGPVERGETRAAKAAEATSPTERGDELQGSLGATTTPFGVGRDCETTSGMHRGTPMWRPLSGCSPRKSRSNVRVREYGGNPSDVFRPSGKP